VDILCHLARILYILRTLEHKIKNNICFKGFLFGKFIKKINIYHLFLFFIFLGCLYTFYNSPQRVHSDGYPYYAYARSIAFDRDLNLSNEYKEFIPQRFHKYQIGKSGLIHLSTQLGPALLWLPFFILGHLLAFLSNLFGANIPLNGYFLPYQNAVCMSSLLYSFIGIILLFSILKEYFKKHISFIAVSAIWLASPLIWYMVYEPSMAHSLSFFAVTLFIYIWFKTRKNRNYFQWLLLAFSGALLINIRYYCGVFLLIPAFESIHSYYTNIKKRNWNSIKDLLLKNLLFLSVAIGGFIAFLIISDFTRGASWLFVKKLSGFSLLSLNLEEFLFSSKHGLFSWHPIMYLAVIGLFMFFKKDKKFTIYAVIPLLILIITLSGLDDWHAGDSFGSRRLTGSIFVFALGLAALIDWLRKHHYIAIGFIMMAFCIWNFSLIGQFKRIEIPRRNTFLFRKVAQNQIQELYKKIGHLPSFPANFIFSLKYGVPIESYGLIKGNRKYNNLHIDIGDISDKRFLGKGWYLPEFANNSFSFRWSQGTESIIFVPLWRAYNYKIKFRAAPFSYKNSSPQIVKIYINEKYLTQISLIEGGYILYEIMAPMEYWKKGQNVVKFKYKYTAVPKKVCNNPDGRDLAVSFDSFSMKIFLTDGELELWDDKNTLTYWRVEGPKGKSSINRDSKEKHSGEYSCRFDIDENNTLRRIYQQFNLKSNKSYILEFWYKTDVDKTYYALITNPSGYFLNPSGAWQKKWATYTGLITNKNWSNKAINFVTDKSGAYYFGIYSYYASSSSLYIDDIILKAE